MDFLWDSVVFTASVVYTYWNTEKSNFVTTEAVVISYSVRKKFYKNVYTNMC